MAGLTPRILHMCGACMLLGSEEEVVNHECKKRADGYVAPKGGLTVLKAIAPPKPLPPALPKPPELDSLPDSYEYRVMSFELKEEGNFTTTFKIKGVQTASAAIEWLRAYEDKSKATWRKTRTIKARGKTNIFRADYRCQHKTDPRRRNIGKRMSKNTNCEAKLKIVIKRFIDAPNLRPVDAETKIFPCVIDLHSWHNHSLNSASILRFRDVSLATKEKLLQYFQTGHSASSARRALQADLRGQNPNEYDTLAADSSVLPSLSIIQHLFNSGFSKTFGARQGQRALTDVETLIKSYCDTTGGQAAVKVVDSHTVVAICTPIMQRTVQLMPEVNELVFVDVSSYAEQLKHRVYFLLSACVVGSAPIGCIITDVEDEEVFKAGVQLLKTCLPESFETGPSVLMTDGDFKEKEVLHEIWPNANFLLSQFHFLIAAWKWISTPQNFIPIEARPSIYFQIKELINAINEETLNQKMTDMEMRIQNVNLSRYLKHMWDMRHLWASCYRKGPINGNNTNNYVEALFRLLRDTILARCKAQTLIQLLDFLLIKYESYLYQWYKDFSCGRYSKGLLKKFLIESKNPVPKKDINFDKDRNCYIVNSENKEAYFVDVLNCFCSCHVGCTGQLCKHISAIVNLQGFEISSQYWYSQETRVIMFKIATDKEPDKDDLTPPHLNTSKFHKSALQDKQTNSQQENISRPDSGMSSHSVGVCDAELRDAELFFTCEHEEIRRKFDQWCDKVRSGLQNNSEIFMPAVKNMLLNDEKFASTEANLVSALNNFGKYSEPSPQRMKQNKKRKQMPVPPAPPAIENNVNNVVLEEEIVCWGPPNQPHYGTSYLVL